MRDVLLAPPRATTWRGSAAGRLAYVRDKHEEGALQVWQQLASTRADNDKRTRRMEIDVGRELVTEASRKNVRNASILARVLETARDTTQRIVRGFIASVGTLDDVDWPPDFLAPPPSSTFRWPSPIVSIPARFARATLSWR